MTFTRVPLLERPLVVTDEILDFQDSLEMFGLTPYRRPVLNLLLKSEAQSVRDLPSHMRICESLGQKILELSEHDTSHAEVADSLLLTRRNNRQLMKYVSLSLRVGAGIGRERSELLAPFIEEGLDTTKRPFNRFQYAITVAEAKFIPADVEREELFAVLNEARPQAVTLGQPQPRL